MDFSALRGCHQRILPVPRKSSASSEHSSMRWFSGFFSFIPAGARLFCLGMLALLLTSPCPDRVGAVTFAFSGFKESDVYFVNDSPWTFQSNTSCFYFDPPEASWNKSVAGRFLYPSLVQMKDPATKRVKSFSTTFIYQIQIPQAYSSTVPIGPGMSFIVVPDNVTVGAAEDYMGLFTADTSTSSKNYESDNHTLGVELDTFRNPEFHDPDGNHIGVDLASMNSTFVVDPVYPLYSFVKDVYTQIWIDYSEADSRMDISIALYGEGKPVTPQGSQTGVDLSLLVEDMYIGFSTAKGIESNNVPYVCAWSFSNDGIPAPPIIMGFDVTSASRSAGVRLSPSRVLISPPLPSASPPPISMANPPSPSTEAPAPAPSTKEGKMWGPFFRNFFILCGIICIPTLLFFWIVYRRPLRIFISYTIGSDGSGKDFPMQLMEKMKSYPKSSRIKIFFDRDNFRLGIPIAATTKELARCDVGIVVVTKEYFERKGPMMELITFAEAEKNDPRNRIRILPLFYGLTPEDLKDHLNGRTWGDSWKEMARGLHPIEVEKCEEAVTWLCNIRGISYNSRNRDSFIVIVCNNIYHIFSEERNLRSNAIWAMNKVIERITEMICIGTANRRGHANQRVGKEIGVIIYINKLLQLLFAVFGLLIILLSVILDNSFNDEPVRFTAFAILAPAMIFLGFLASGWFPRIPLRFIAFLKRRGFLQHVVPCSPWHDNVVTDFCGKVCTLEPLVQDEGSQGTRPFEFPMLVQDFLYRDWIPPPQTAHTTYSHSTLDLNTRDSQPATSRLERQGQDDQEVSTLNPQSEDFRTNNVLDQAFKNEIREHPHTVVATSQVSSSNSQEASSRVEDIIVEMDHSRMLRTLGDEKAFPTLEIEGPMINGFPLKVQVFKNMLTRDHAFVLSYTFRNKKTRRMNLTIERLRNLVQNMYQWVNRPYPIVVDESSDILHCMATQDILWAFTKNVYTFDSVPVKHRYLAGMEMGGSATYVSITFVSLMVSIIPLVWDKKSYWFLLFLIVLAACVLKSMYIPYYFRTLLCPIYLKFKGFRTLYMSKSSFIWCNEFRKKKIVNPNSFWIDQECANKLSDANGCFDMGELVILPGNPFRGEIFRIACQGWPEDNPTRQHDYELEVNFDTVNPDDTCYTNVKLSFFENDDLLGTRKYSFVEIQRLQLIEKFFYCYSNPSFGGYIETIRPCSWSQSYLGNCRRFLDVCDKIITDNTMPIPWEAATKSDYQFIIGVPF